MNKSIIIKANPADLSELKSQYLKQLPAPLDGMWMSFIEAAVDYSIVYRDEIAGYCVINGERKLLQFSLDTVFDARPVFGQIIVELDVSGAVVSTFEYQHLALCMDHQKSAAVNAFLYQLPAESKSNTPEFPAGLEFSLVENVQRQQAVDFAVAALGADAGWLDAYYAERIDGDELWGLWERGELIATGECRPSRVQQPYADLGMVVAKSHRGLGLGTNILRCLIDHCRENRLRPICSTTRENVAAQRAIENAGFVSPHRILDVAF